MKPSNHGQHIVAIHQPNFFPWLGYFNKMARADTFIIMDNVQFPKTSRGTWSNRVRLIVNGKATWLTMPIVRNYHGHRCYHEMLIDNRQPWRERILTTIKTSYGRAPYFKTVFPFLRELINNFTESLVDYNITAIQALILQLGLDQSKLILGSQLNISGSSTDLLIAMVKAVDGTAYLCGGGASGYQEDEKFYLAGLTLIYQNFQHPNYPQFNTQEFNPGLSIIDTLMNCGFTKTKELINIK